MGRPPTPPGWDLPEATAIVAGPDPASTRSIRAFLRAGFVPVGTIPALGDDGLETLPVLARPQRP